MGVAGELRQPQLATSEVLRRPDGVVPEVGRDPLEDGGVPERGGLALGGRVPVEHPWDQVFLVQQDPEPAAEGGARSQGIGP